MPSPCATPPNLALNQRRIDRASHIMRRRDLQHLHRAEFRVHLDLGHVRANPAYGIRNSLPVLVQWTCRRIKRRFARDHISMLIKRQIIERERVGLVAVAHGYPAIVTIATATAKMDTRTVTGAR